MSAQRKVYAQSRQPDPHPRRRRAPHGSNGATSESAARKTAAPKGAGRTSLRNDQALVWLHLLFSEGPGASAGRMDPDDPGLQLETSAEAGPRGRTAGG